MKNKMKSINKQKELASALWDFAKGLQKSEVIKSDICARIIDNEGFEIKMDMTVMDETLHRIAKNFNLEI